MEENLDNVLALIEKSYICFICVIHVYDYANEAIFKPLIIIRIKSEFLVALGWKHGSVCRVLAVI